MSNKRNHTDMDTLIADVAEALYEGDKDVERAVNVVGLISIVVPPLSKFLDTINNEVDRLAMADGYDELPIIRGGQMIATVSILSLLGVWFLLASLERLPLPMSAWRRQEKEF